MLEYYISAKLLDIFPLITILVTPCLHSTVRLINSIDWRVSLPDGEPETSGGFSAIVG